MRCSKSDVDKMQSHNRISPGTNKDLTISQELIRSNTYNYIFLVKIPNTRKLFKHSTGSSINKLSQAPINDTRRSLLRSFHIPLPPRLPRIYDTRHNVRNQLHATLRSRDATEITILTAPICNKLPIPMQSSRVKVCSRFAYANGGQF